MEVTLRSFLLGTQFEPIAEGISDLGLRNGIPYGFGVTMLKLLPADESGMNIFDVEWDVLVVLDTCRPEWIEEISADYSFIRDVSDVRSVGARTSEWVARTFKENKLSDEQVYYLFGSKYGAIGPDIPAVERIRVESDGFPYPPAHVMTDEALKIIHQNKNNDDSRVIIHYAQPHLPVYETNGSRTSVKIREGSEGGALEAYSKGPTELESLHLDNLRYVMDEVETLVEGLDGQDIVLTADHGQMLGERFIVGHPHGLRHKAVRNVPWVRL